MKVSMAQVQNFRSVVDSQPVDIADRVTVLIGKNEQGKTNFLRGLASFNTDSQYTSGDLPNHLLAQLEDADPVQIPIVRLWLIPDSQDR